MGVYQLFDHEDFGDIAFQQVVKAVNDNHRPNPTIIFPTGGTPEPLYTRIAELRSFFPMFDYINLDQYYGIEYDDPRSYPFEIEQKLLKALKLKPDLQLVFNATAQANHECHRIENAIRHAGGIDIAVIGIGPNGHIAFNEPKSDFNTRAHLVDLTPETIAANQKYCAQFGGVPPQALTLGLGTIMEAKKIILLTNKPEITLRALHGSVTTDVPASVLQRHPNLTVVATPQVGAKLRLAA